MSTVDRDDPAALAECISVHFPFSKFFNDAPQPLFKGEHGPDMAKAEACWRHIRDVFTQLDEFRAFELLRSGLDRTR